jgi:hypothetical protein
MIAIAVAIPGKWAWIITIFALGLFAAGWLA